MGFKKQLILLSFLCACVQASASSLLCEDLDSVANAGSFQGGYLSISLVDQTLASSKRPCRVTVDLSNNSTTVRETFQLTRQDDLRTVELGRFNKIDVSGCVMIPQRACPDPRGTKPSPTFSAHYLFDGEQVYSLKIVLSNNPQDLNVTQVQFLERRYDCAAKDF